MSVRDDIVLHYDRTRWIEREVRPQNTLQIFITDVCNLRCEGCFYFDSLGSAQMSPVQYRAYLQQALPRISKVTLLGGEPTLHKKLPEFLEHNVELGLPTTVYTNGVNLNALEPFMRDPLAQKMVSFRIGVHGVTMSEKPLAGVPDTLLPVTIVYMLDQRNRHELTMAAQMAQTRFRCTGFYLSSIREMEKTNDFWKDTARTIPMPEYAAIVQRFVQEYDGTIPRLHISTRGVLVTEAQKFTDVKRCRITSILRDGRIVLSPWDISLNNTNPNLVFNEQPCKRHHKCVLQKIVLERKTA